jgi:hypothetical protein
MTSERLLLGDDHCDLSFGGAACTPPGRDFESAQQKLFVSTTTW